MPPGGWGRRAAGRSDRKLEDDALFKEIGGQLDATHITDYSQWERGNERGKSATRGPVRRPPHIERPTSTTGFTVSSAAYRAGDTSGCHHRRYAQPQAPVKRTENKQQLEKIKVLQLRIHARKQTIEEYRRRQVELLESNMLLRTQIEQEEKETHEKVKQLLRKYDKFRGGIATLNGKFGSELYEAKTDLRKSKEISMQELTKVRQEVNMVDRELQEQQRELALLASYKDKEYPVKALRIADLQKEIEQLKLNNEEEEEDLQRIVDMEMDKVHRHRQQTTHNIQEQATQQAMALIDPGLEDMALQNRVIEREIAQHVETQTEMNNAIAALEIEVKKMLKDPKTNVRLQMFPEFFPTREKCTPDMDVVLNIPTHKWLPI